MKKINWQSIIPISILLCLMALLPFLILKKNKEPELLPLLGRLPPFVLINQNEEKVPTEEFWGAVLVVNFIFTSCPDSCPLLTSQMAKIQSMIEDPRYSDVKLLSITVDPSTDTASVLKHYAEKYNANFNRWSFLTGSVSEVQKVVSDGFKISMQKQGASDDAIKDVTIMDLTHGEQFVVVDKNGDIRAYRSAATPQDLDRILSVLDKLI